MRVSVGQFSASLDKRANLQRISDLARQAAEQHAHLLVLPEASMCDFGRPNDDLTARAEPLDGSFVAALGKLASAHRLTLLAGMFESIDRSPLVHNTAVVVSPDRGLIAWYRKRRLFDALGDRESLRFAPGAAEPPLFELEGFRIGVLICYELRFPDQFEQLAGRGADVVALPSAWVAGPLKEDHWSVLTRARAVDCTIYVAASGQVGGRYAGRSSIVDPFGAPLAGLAEAESVAVAEISRERLDDVRRRLPLLEQRGLSPASSHISS